MSAVLSVGGRGKREFALPCNSSMSQTLPLVYDGSQSQQWRKRRRRHGWGGVDACERVRNKESRIYVPGIRKRCRPYIWVFPPPPPISPFLFFSPTTAANPSTPKQYYLEETLVPSLKDRNSPWNACFTAILHKVQTKRIY